MHADRIPVSAAARELSEGSAAKALERALSDGEDYELLFTVPAAQERTTSDMPAGMPRLSQIGRIVAEPGLFLEQAGGARRCLEPRGWVHRFGDEPVASPTKK